MYTNIVNIPDSILFLTSCRLAIKESVMVNEELEKYTKLGLVDFVMNEATDYQVMSIVVNDEFIEEKYDAFDELNLFDQYKEMVVDNISEFSSVMGSEDLKSILYEIGPISQEGLSTATPILEFLYESGVLYEKGKMSDWVKAAKEKASKGKVAAGKVKDKASDIAFDAQVKSRALKKRMGYKAQKTGKAIKGAASSAKEKVISAKDAAKQKASDVAFDAKAKARALKKSIPHKTRSMARTGGEKVQAAMGTKAGKAGAIALAAAAIYAGVKVYQRFMSQAAKACSSQSGGAKTTCMAKYKSNALRGQIAATQRGVSACAKAKDPVKCKASIQARVQKLQNKLSKVGA